MYIKSQKTNTFILFSWIILFSFLFVIFFSPIHFPFTKNNYIDTKIVSYIITGNKDNINFLEENEINHMFDVRLLIIIASILFLITNILLLNKKFKPMIKEKFDKQILKKILIVFNTICILSIIFFNIFFTLFHKILFPQGNWQFPHNSLLIQTYPESFFIWMFVIILLIINTFSILLILTKKEKTHKKYKKNN